MVQTREAGRAVGAARPLGLSCGEADNPNVTRDGAAAQAHSLLDAIEAIGRRSRSMARNAIGSDRDYSLCDLLQELDAMSEAIGELRRAVSWEATS